MAIEVGDAVLRFLGDSTQLESAFTQVGETAEQKLGPARITLEEINEQLKATGGTAISALAAQQQYGEAVALTSEELVNAQREAAGFGTEAQIAGEKAAFSMREAKGEIALLGEEIGIQIPRHLRGFVAELPGVGQALNAAFSATAVLLLLQLLAEATEKVTSFVSETFIFTEAQKESNKAIGEANKQLEDLSKQYDDATDKLEKYGKNAVELTAENVAKLAKEQVEAKEKLDELTKGYAGFRQGVEATGVSLEAFNKAQQVSNGLFAEIATKLPFVGEAFTAYYNKKAADSIETSKGEAENQINIQAGILRTKKAQQDLADKEQATADENAYRVREQGSIDADKVIYQSRIDFAKAAALFEAQGLKAEPEIRIAIEQRAAEQEYELNVSLLTRKAALLERDPTKNAKALEKAYAEIDAVRSKEHERERVDVDVLTRQIQASVQTNINGPLLQFTEVTLAGVTNGFVEASAAAAKLGFSTDADLKKALVDTEKAFKQLKDSGTATYGDLLKGQIAVSKASLEVAKDQGTATDEQVKDLKRLEDEYNKLYGVTDKVYAKHTQLFQLWQKGAPSAAEAYKGAMDIAEQGLDKLGKAADSAFTAAILGQESLGAALAKATEQTLAQLAAQSIVQALFYTAMGFAKLAVYDFGGAQNAFTAAAIYGAVGGAAAGAAIGIGAVVGNGSGGSSGAGGTSPGTNTVAGNANQALSSTATQAAPNVQKFANGGLVSAPTLALLGEETGRGNEAAIPLDNPEAVAKIKKALVGDDGAGHTVIHQTIVQGMISPDNLHKVMQKMSKAADKGRGRLTSSNSGRLTRKV